MESALPQALELMGIALPTMFFVILLFMGVISLLTRMFPEREDKKDE